MRVPTRSDAIHLPALEHLRAEVGDDRALVAFIDRYLELLPARVHAINRACRDPQMPCETAWNLAASSRMLGAFTLAEHLEQLAPDGPPLGSPACRVAFLRRTLQLVRPVRVALGGYAARLRATTHDDRRLA